MAALPRTTVTSWAMANDARLSRMTAIAAAFRSIRMTRFAPRLKASIPTAPLPAYASRNTVPGIRGASVLNNASRSRSGVGRTSMPGTLFSFRLRNRPAITLISADLHEAVFSLPMVLDVVNYGAQFLFIAAFNHFLRFCSRHLQHIRVAQQVSHAQSRYPRLFGSEKFARPAQPHIHIGDVEAVVRFD